MPNPAEINVLYNQDFMNDPFPYFQAGLEHAPIARNEETLTKPFYVFRYQDVRRVLQDYETFTSNLNPDDASAEMALGRAVENLIEMDPPRHTKMRRLAQQGFPRRVLKELIPRAEAIVKERVDNAFDQGEIDLAGDFSSPITIGMISTILGLPLEDQSMIRQWTIDIANNVMANNWVYEFEQDRADITVKVTGEMADYFHDYIKRRKSSPEAGDIVSIMLTTEIDGDRFTNDEVESTTMLLLLAGNDTTTHLISNYVTCMANHPEQADQVRQDPSLIAQSIEEVLRYAPSLLCMERGVAKPVTLHGVEIVPGDVMIAWIAAANRDPKQFERPNDFDISRRPNRHIAFGFGAHFCLGAPLARLESRIAVEELMRRTSGFELIGPAGPQKNAIIHGPAHQRVRFIPK